MRRLLQLLLCGTVGCQLQGVDDIAWFPDLGGDLAVADQARADQSTATGDASATSDLSTSATANCGKICPPCAVDQLCIGAIAEATYATTCRPRCATSGDCGNGESCVSLVGEAGAVCVAPGVPPVCPGPADGGPFHCSFSPPACLDASTLARAYIDVDTGACGIEHLFCAHGCAPPDDGGTLARCNL